MKPQAQIEYKPLSELKELPGNPRTIKKDQFEKLKKSIQDNPDYFEARPIILSDRTGENIILAGNQRYKAAKALKMEQVPTITLHGLTEARERVFTISTRMPIEDTEIFPEPQELTTKLKDILEDNPDERYFLTDEQVASFRASTEKAKDKGNGFKFEPIERERESCTA